VLPLDLLILFDRIGRLFDRITAIPLTRGSVQALGRKMHFLPVRVRAGGSLTAENGD
jgi:hypothetical protein